MAVGEKSFKTLTSIVEQLELCNYKTSDGLHDLKDNAAFIELQKLAEAEQRYLLQGSPEGNDFNLRNVIAKKANNDESQLNKLTLDMSKETGFPPEDLVAFVYGKLGRHAPEIAEAFCSFLNIDKQNIHPGYFRP